MTVIVLHLLTNSMKGLLLRCFPSADLKSVSLDYLYWMNNRICHYSNIFIRIKVYVFLSHLYFMFNAVLLLL